MILLACATTDDQRKRAASLGAFRKLMELDDRVAASKVASKALESIAARYSFDAGDVAFLDDQGALAVDLEAIAPLIEGETLKKLFGEARRVFPLAPAPLLRVVAHTSETATGDLRKVPYGARLAVCTETTALTLSEDGGPAWAPARIDDVAKPPPNDALPPDATTVTSSNGAVAPKDARAGSTPQNSRNLWCVRGLRFSSRARVPAGAVGVVACHGGEKDTPLAVRWDSAPRAS